MRNVLSLFNGISGLHLALDKANIKVDNVYYAEIDKFANKVKVIKMKDNLRGRKLDHNYCVLRMNAMEKIAYNFIYKDTEFRNSDWCVVIDKFIETCIAADMLVREPLYYPKL